MADVSTVTMPDSSVKNIKDSTARSSISELVDGGAKNHVPLSFTPTSADITVAYSDNKLIINGSSATAQSVYSNIYLDVGTYMLTGCPTGGGTDNYQCELRTSTQGSMGVVDTGNGKQFTITTAGNYRYNVRIAANYTASNLEISPMICSKADWDISQTYQPYRKDLAELTVDSDEDRTALVELVDGGAKNVLEFDAIGSTTYGSVYESNGVRFTLNTDNTVTFERISASSSNANCLLILNGARLDVSSYCDGTHILSGCPSGGRSSTYEIMATVSGGAYTMRDYGTGVILDSVSGVAPYIQLTVRSGFTGTATFKPMICTLPAWKISQAYQPYRPSYQELYERVVALEQTNQ